MNKRVPVRCQIMLDNIGIVMVNIDNIAGAVQSQQDGEKDGEK